jgi:hypothetical protein
MNGLPGHKPQISSELASGVYVTSGFPFSFYRYMGREVFLTEQLIFAIKTYFRKMTRHRFHVDFSELDDLLGSSYFFEIYFTRKDRKRLDGTRHDKRLMLQINERLQMKIGNGLTDGLYYDKSKKLTSRIVRKELNRNLKRNLKMIRKHRYTKEI